MSLPKCNIGKLPKCGSMACCLVCGKTGTLTNVDEVYNGTTSWKVNLVMPTKTKNAYML